jgi:butyryl-CoA dehydrogenase
MAGRIREIVLAHQASHTFQRDTMYDLHLSQEQLEIRDTVRSFVENEIKPLALKPERLEPFAKPLMREALEQAAQMGLRTLTLSEASGGIGADTLTHCIVLEELAAGDVDLAAALMQTSLIARVLFEDLMSEGQRKRFLPAFLDDHDYHLACTGWRAHPQLGWHYHRLSPPPAVERPTAVLRNTEWVIDGSVAFVANAPIARLFAVEVAIRDPGGTERVGTLLVPRDASGLAVQEDPAPDGDDADMAWHHGPGSAVVFRRCRVPEDAFVGHAQHPTMAAFTASTECGAAALSLGIGRAAYDAALAYSKLRRQGGRNIIEHQSIGTLLANCAIRLEAARALIWKAAWALEHPDAIADGSLANLPLHEMARIFTSEVVHEVTLNAAECFGAMGVMRDMPLQKYVDDALVSLHGEPGPAAAKLMVAEAVAGFQRPTAA